MKLIHHVQGDSLSNLFLYTAIMFANIDYKGIADYLIKAVLGGAVWFAFKLLQDHYSEKVKHNIRKHLKNKEGGENCEEKNGENTNEENK